MTRRGLHEGHVDNALIAILRVFRRRPSSVLVGLVRSVISILTLFYSLGMLPSAL
jgi:hypothetical protein